MPSEINAHIKRLNECLNNLKGNAVPVDTAVHFLLNLYGLKVLWEHQDTYSRLGLDLQTSAGWGHLIMAPDDHTERNFEQIWHEFLRTDHRLAFLDVPSDLYFQGDPYLAHRIIQAIDRLGFPEPSSPDFIGYGRVVRHLIQRLERNAGEHVGTPEVNQFLATLLPLPENQTVYDPACGYGGSLVAVHQAAVERGISTDGFFYFGQDIDLMALRYCTWHLLLSGVIQFRLVLGNTLTNPHFMDQPNETLTKFDCVITQPPFVTRGNQDFERSNPRLYFQFGPANGRTLDFTFMQHVLMRVKKDGQAAMVVAQGTLSRSGIEAKTRQAIIEKGLIRAVISLPAGALGSKTAVQASIVVFQPAQTSTSIVFVDLTRVARQGGSKALTRDHMALALEALNAPEDHPDVCRVVRCQDVIAMGADLVPGRHVTVEAQHRSLSVINQEVQALEDLARDSRSRLDSLLEMLGR